jgi:uncharacterized RDD family membrane protein YckC
MVVDDNSQLPPPLSIEDRLASPTDRFAAAVADFVIVSPLATLVMSPFHRIAEEAQLQGHDDRWLIATLTSFGAALLVVIAYQVICLIKWRATPGKRLMGLTVESLWQDEGAPMKAQSALLRTVAWCLEAALLGCPWIAVIGNERRRPFHDRLADTIVLSKRKSKVGPPGLSEMSLASGLVAAFFTSLLIVATFKIGQSKFGLGSKLSAADSESESTSGACEQVDHAQKTWVEGLGEKKPSRISIALSLYEADSIDEECLKGEADSALWKSESKDLAYLARGLAEKADEELSQTYLDKACDGSNETDACKALAFLNEEEIPDDPVEAKSARVAHDNEMLSIIDSLKPDCEPFLKVLAIRDLTTRRQPARALAMIDAFSPQRDLSFFLSSERMKTLWAMNRKNEARLSLKVAVGGFDSDQRVAISRWFCQTETSESGCSEQSKPACEMLAASVEHDSVLLGDPEVTMTYIRGETCADRMDETKLADLKQEMPDIFSQNYVDALIALGKDAANGQKLLRDIVAKGDDGGPFVIESQAKLVELAKTEKELSPIREAWLDTEQSQDGWAFLGRKLMDRYNQFKAWDQTIELGFKMGESDPLDQQAARSFIVAAYRSGQTKMAMGYLQTYFSKPTEDISVRQPASVDGFDEIAREIRTDFDNGTVQRSPRAMPTKLPPKLRGRGK